MNSCPDTKLPSLAPAEGNQALENNLISADLPSLGQLRPRDEIRFEQVDWGAARSLLLEQEKLLTSPDLFVL
jgi:allophanate hydrolase subunit 2